jgi:hypothetical protein
MARVAGFSWIKGAAGLFGIKDIPREGQPASGRRRQYVTSVLRKPSA